MPFENRAVMCVIRRCFCDDGLCEILYLLSESCKTLVIYSLIPVIFKHLLCLLVILCIFPQMSVDCQPLTVQNMEWGGMMGATEKPWEPAQVT